MSTIWVLDLLEIVGVGELHGLPALKRGIKYHATLSRRIVLKQWDANCFTFKQCCGSG